MCNLFSQTKSVEAVRRLTSFCDADVKPATWNWCSPMSNPRPLFAFAEIWQVWNGLVKKDGPAVVIDVFSFIDTEGSDFAGSRRTKRRVYSSEGGLLR